MLQQTAPERRRPPTESLYRKQISNVGPWIGWNWRPNPSKDKNSVRRTIPMPMIHQATRKSYMVLPYVKGLSESMKNVAKNHGIQTYFREAIPSKASWWLPKTRTTYIRKVASSTGSSATGWRCDDEYIGESSRTFGERFKEHLKAPSPIYDHYKITDHETSIENFSIVGREDQNLIRAIKEAIYIRVNNPSLNRNIGKYHLPHIWDEVLLNNSEQKLK